jgi:glycosyltransferase involved in cell wall biosynthesis
MTLLLNYRPVLRQPTGIGVYANAVLPALQGFPHVLIPGGEQGTARQRLRRLAWSQLRLPQLARQKSASLIFTPAPEGYLGPQIIPQVVMVHDLRPISHPDRSLQSLYFRRWVPPLLRQCRHIVTNSAFTAGEIQRMTGVSSETISVIPLGVDTERFRPAAQGRLDLQGRPYLLHVGQAYPHKNLGRLIEAFAAIANVQPELQLVLAGKPHPSETRRLQALVLERGLQQRGLGFCVPQPVGRIRVAGAGGHGGWDTCAHQSGLRHRGGGWGCRVAGGPVGPGGSGGGAQRSRAPASAAQGAALQGIGTRTPLQLGAHSPCHA